MMMYTLEYIAKVLNALPNCKTRLIRACNTNCITFDKYLAFMLLKGLVIPPIVCGKGGKYTITGKGLSIKLRLNAVYDMLGKSQDPFLEDPFISFQNENP